MTAELSEYNGLLEVGPDGISQVEVISTGNPLPEPQVITPGEMGENLEGEIGPAVQTPTSANDPLSVAVKLRGRRRA